MDLIPDKRPIVRLVERAHAVLRQLEPFFRPRNYTNVRGLFVFGY